MSQSKSKYILACDIGGTHITAAIVASNTWSILPETIQRAEINSAENAKSIFQGWASAINKTLDQFAQPINQIGIAMPGPFDYDKGISLMQGQGKYDELYQLNVTTGLSPYIHTTEIQIRYINDAAAFLQGEIFATGRQQENRILGITLGTGLGSAVWQQGSKAIDADLWNSPYKNSIFEKHLVTRWFTKRFKELTGIQEPGFKEIIEKHKSLPEFGVLMSEYRTHLLDFLQYFSEKHQAKKFIIGGNIANAWETINAQNTFHAFDISLGQYAEKAALIGAASLFE